MSSLEETRKVMDEVEEIAMTVSIEDIVALIQEFKKIDATQPIFFNLGSRDAIARAFLTYRTDLARVK